MRFLSCIILLSFSSCLFAVNSSIVRHSRADDFAAAKPNNIVINSQGNISLANESHCLLKDIPDTWVINTVLTKTESDGKEAIFFGTSPNGILYKYKDGRLETFYKKAQKKLDAATDSVADPNEAGKKIEKEEKVTNEHIFALALDRDGNLLAAVSGEDCRVVKFREDGKSHVVCELDDAFYIFALYVNDAGDIFLATGPEGKIYKIDSGTNEPKVFASLKERNILSLAADKEGNLYAGADENGVLYKFDMLTKKQSVVFDSKQNDITAIVFDDDGNLYFSAANAKAMPKSDNAKHVAKSTKAGSADVKDDVKRFSKSQGVFKIQIANSNRGKRTSSRTKKSEDSKNSSVVYKISPKGFSSKVYSQSTLFLSMLYDDNKLLVATSNAGELITIDTKTDIATQSTPQKDAKQITAIAKYGEGFTVATANQAMLVGISKHLAKQGELISSLIDAKQPALWGKIQLDADIPTGASIKVSFRSSNTSKEDDNLFSVWSEPREIVSPLNIDCPVGRFLQYKLILTGDNDETPLVREIAISNLIENIAPEIVSISTSSPRDKGAVVLVSFLAKDKNKDKLSYQLDFRLVDSSRWILIDDKIKKSPFEWDSRTVSDGVYQLRLRVDDAKSNSPTTTKSASWISDPVVVDNTAPVVASSDVAVEDSKAIIKVSLEDQLSMIASFAFTVDSSKDWISTIPDDLVFDTSKEEFTIVTDELEKADHVVTIKASDDAGNVVYKSFYVTIE